MKGLLALAAVVCSAVTMAGVSLAGSESLAGRGPHCSPWKHQYGWCGSIPRTNLRPAQKVCEFQGGVFLATAGPTPAYHCFKTTGPRFPATQLRIQQTLCEKGYGGSFGEELKAPATFCFFY